MKITSIFLAHIFRCLLFLLFLCSCNGKSQPLSKVQELKDSIVIIFKEFPKQRQKIQKAGGIWYLRTDSIIQIYDEYNVTSHQPESLPKNDTLSIKVRGDYIALRHIFRETCSMDYLFRRGDTIIFTYKDGVPYGNIINRKVSGTADVNYEYLWRMHVKLLDKQTPFEIFTMPVLSPTLESLSDYFKKEEKIIETNYRLSKAMFDQEDLFLDSLLSVNEISLFNYQFHKEKTKFLRYKVDLQQDALSEDSIAAIFKSEQPKEDNFPHSYFSEFFEAFVEHKILPTAKKITHSRGKHPDYRAVFDTISALSFVRQPFKNLLLYRYLDNIAYYFSSEDLEIYLKKFELLSNSSEKIKSIRNNYIISQRNVSSSADSLFLMTLGGKRTTFRQILSENTGKLIYVDFWASWCAPCREVMPEAIVLSERYKDQPLIVVYISLDKKFDAWKSASIQDNISEDSHSYVVVNSQLPNIFKELKLTSIPRYLFIDTNGNIVHTNAPGPKGIEIGELIEKFGSSP